MLRTEGKWPLLKGIVIFITIAANIQYSAVNYLFYFLILIKSHFEHHLVASEFQVELCTYAYASILNTCVFQPCCRVSRSESQSGAS